jgi:hypothetical protein
MDYLETKATLGTKHRTKSNKWTIQRQRQHWAQSTERSQTNGLSRDKGNIGHKAQNEVKQMDFPETKATLGTKHRTKSNKWTI